MWPFRRKSAADALPEGEVKGQTLDQILAAFAGTKSAADIRVDEATALRTATVIACVSLIANDVAAMPLRVMRRTTGGQSVEASDTRAFDLLFKRPNPMHTAFEFRQMVTAQACLHGEGFAYKQRDAAGRVTRLWPLQNRDVSVNSSGMSINYTVSAYDGDITGTFTSREIMHLRGLMWDGYQGLSRISTARDAIGLSVGAERTQSKAFANGTRMPGYWSTDSTLSPDAVSRIADALRAATAGSNQWKSPLLDNGIKWNTTGMAFEDAQLVETRKHQMVEVCAHFGVSPAVLGLDDKTQAFASVEAMMRWHLQHTLRPWLTAWEQAVDRDILDTAAGPLFAAFDTRDLEKASAKEQADAFRTLVELGIYTRNEARSNMGLPALPGLDEPLTPANMVTADEDRTVTDPA